MTYPGGPLQECPWKPETSSREGSQTLSAEDHRMSNLDLAGHTVSVTANQLCCCNVKAPTGNN